MSDISKEARRLYAKRDRLERELAEIDAQLLKLRSEYMKQESTCGLRPEAFRRAVEIRKAA